MRILLVGPLLIPLFTACLCMLLTRWFRVRRITGLLGAITLLFCNLKIFQWVRVEGIQTLQMGSWQAPFGITLVADGLSCLMLLVTSILAVLMSIYALSNIDVHREKFSYHALFHILIMGISGAFLTGDLFNLYVWFEVMLIASFVLMALGRDHTQLEAAVKYVTLNLFSSAFFLLALGFIYGQTGTLNMAHLALKFQDSQTNHAVNGIAMLLFIAFGIKAALFPLFFWLPASYHTPPVSISAFFAGLLTKVGLYSLIRVFSLIFVQDLAFFHHSLFLWVAGLTMVIGVLGAVAQYDMRRLLSFHIVSQMGYMMMGLAIFSTQSLTATLYFMLHNILCKTNLFLVSGVIQRLRGTIHLKHLGGLFHNYPMLSLLFFISAFSLAGLPPLSGFIGKLALLQASIHAHFYLIALVSLAVGLCTLYSMTKIWNYAFWSKNDFALNVDRYTMVPFPGQTCLILPIVILSCGIVALGLFYKPVLDILQDTAQQLIDRQEYMQSVLGADVM